MAQAVRVRELRAHDGKTVRVLGWITHVRSSGKVAFLVIRDGTGTVQAVLARDAVRDSTWERLANVTIESSVEAVGTVRADARAPGGYELALTELTVLG